MDVAEPPTAVRIFISYRRDDTRSTAGRIFDRLTTHFGVGAVFMDVDSISPGRSFTDAIGHAVTSCQVMLAMIGNQWLTLADEHGRRRIDLRADYVAMEISSGLARGIPVIPVLVDGAARLREQDALPAPLAGLTRQQGLRIDHESFTADVGALITALEGGDLGDLRQRAEELASVAARVQALRSARLAPFVPRERLDEVIAWMAQHAEPTVVVPEGQLRVLVAPMGAGKSERALCWAEEGLAQAARDPQIGVPVWRTAREIASSLESAVTEAHGHGPLTRCRVVIDDLDGIAPRDAGVLLDQARLLVHLWPKVSVLATAQPGLVLHDGERLPLVPWPVARGADLLQVVAGDGRHLGGSWAPEVADVLTNPLSVLALAARLQTGGSARVTRLELLSGLVDTIIRQRHSANTDDDTWRDLARLAVRLLGRRGPVRAGSFAPAPRVRRMVATDLVVDDDGQLTFALPVFEQHFGAEAITTGDVTLETAAQPASFPGWRYAIAFAVATAETPVQEQLMTRLAQTNPAAASWVLTEVTADRGIPCTATRDLTDTAITTMIATARGTEGPVSSDECAPGTAVLAGQWLRDAEQAFLDGLGPLADSLANRDQGRLTQWGAWLESGQVTLAEARTRVPPPEVVPLEQADPEITLASGWARWSRFRFPDAALERWAWTHTRLRKGLLGVMRRRTLLVPPSSRLAVERLWFLGHFVMNYGTTHRGDVLELPLLRERVADWMTQVEKAVHCRWQDGAKTVESDDIRWLHAQLQSHSGDVLPPPWPGPDRPHAAGRWIWERYSPELTLATATGILCDALDGYQALVEQNFLSFGAALGLHSMLPLRVEGLVARDPGDTDQSQVRMMIELIPDPQRAPGSNTPVQLQLVTERADAALYEFAYDRQQPPRSPFQPRLVQDLALDLHVPRPATNLAYTWLADDLQAVGWLDAAIRYDN